MMNVKALIITFMIMSLIMTAFQYLTGSIDCIITALVRNFNVLVIDLILCSVIYHLIANKISKHE